MQMYGHSEEQAVGSCVAGWGRIHRMNPARQLQTAVFRQEPLQDWNMEADEPKESGNVKGMEGQESEGDDSEDEDD